MLNLVSETPPLGRQERVDTTVTATAATRGNHENSSNTCLHGHLDLSLGISLSHCGGSCDASNCVGNNESYGGRQGIRDDNDVRCMTSGTTAANVITSGHSHVGDLTAGVGWEAAFIPTPTSFVHPWSLAARQQKAAAEQDRTPPTTYMARWAKMLCWNSQVFPAWLRTSVLHGKLKLDIWSMSAFLSLNFIWIAFTG